jgi:serine/threonine protein kinase
METYEKRNYSVVLGNVLFFYTVKKYRRQLLQCNGSLLLHGAVKLVSSPVCFVHLLRAGIRGSGRTPLDWEARMRSALSAARGLAQLHAANLVHGNVKASNVLLRPYPDAAALSDFCLHPLFAPSSTRVGGYRAPEVVDTRRISFKADVYSLGVLLLELLTGKSPSHPSLEGDGTLDLPRWVQSVVREEWTAEVFDVDLVRLGASAEEEMVALLQVAMACVATVPDARPDAPDVVRMIEEIGGGGRTTTEESEEGHRGTSEEERSRGTPPAAPTP